MESRDMTIELLETIHLFTKIMRKPPNEHGMKFTDMIVIGQLRDYFDEHPELLVDPADVTLPESWESVSGLQSRCLLTYSTGLKSTT